MSEKNLSNEERIRYARTMAVDGIGEEGQKKLLASSVFVLGSGALGSVAAAYLAGAGVGRITVADFDTVDISNLQRQILYREEDAGIPKAELLAGRLRGINSSIEVTAVGGLIGENAARRLFAAHDFIIDASDNPDTKYMTDRLCAEVGRPYSLAGVLGFRAQIMTCIPGRARYSDLFPVSAGSGYTPCSIGGVVGPLPGIVGSIQALEAIKYFTGAGELLTDRLLVVDTATMSFTTLDY